MLAGATSLAKMTLGPRSVLGSAGLDNISTRTDSDGRWYLPNYTWFGDCTDMKDRYDVTGNSLGAGARLHLGRHDARRPLQEPEHLVDLRQGEQATHHRLG